MLEARETHLFNTKKEGGKANFKLCMRGRTQLWAWNFTRVVLISLRRKNPMKKRQIGQGQEASLNDHMPKFLQNVVPLEVIEGGTQLSRM